MKDISVQNHTSDLVSRYWLAARDALKRTQRKSKKSGEDSLKLTGIEIGKEVLTTAILSFQSVEAFLNRIFYEKVRDSKSNDAFDRWLKTKWKFGLSLKDKLTLMLHKYAGEGFQSYPVLFEVFIEFTQFRNRLVHTRPQDYEILTSHKKGNAKRGVVEDVYFPCEKEPKFQKTKFNLAFPKLNLKDAEKCYEIMLMMLCFLSEKFKVQTGIIYRERGKWYGKGPKEELESLTKRYFKKVKIEKPNKKIVTKDRNPFR